MSTGIAIYGEEFSRQIDAELASRGVLAELPHGPSDLTDEEVVPRNEIRPLVV
jgi:hypothetical protein